jgi:uncharacterized protein YciI
MTGEAVFAVRRRYGKTYRPDLPLEAQLDWAGHARFIDGLVEVGVVLFAGPLLSRGEALLVVRAENAQGVEQALAADPWTANGILETIEVAAWALRVGMERLGPADP